MKEYTDNNLKFIKKYPISHMKIPVRQPQETRERDLEHKEQFSYSE